jgi:hypothetical protein
MTTRATLKTLVDSFLTEDDFTSQQAVPQQAAAQLQPTTTEAPQAVAPAVTMAPQAEPASEEHQTSEKVVFETVCAVLDMLKEFCGTCQGEQYVNITAKSDELCSALQQHLQSYAQPNQQDPAQQPQPNMGGVTPRIANTAQQSNVTPHPGSMSNVVQR